jgi:SAM-dependent methyltransferase
VTFSGEWEEIYNQGLQNSIWPWSDLVSYVMRYARPSGRSYKVLELGFGAGANVGFFASLGVEYFGMEGSESAVKRVGQRFAGQPDITLACGDFSQSIPFNGPFDLVVDRSSLTHNSTAAIRGSLQAIGSRMKPGAKFIGIDWFSTDNPQFLAGRESGDYHTRSDFQSEQFKGVGIVHFSDQEHLMGLLSGSGFEIERLEHKHSEIVLPEGTDRMAWWNFVATKR